MSPELVTVLVAVQRRARGNQPQIPLSVRYDPHEKQHGEPLPHLFARRVGARQEVLSNHYVRTVLIATADAAGIADAGRPLAFTPTTSAACSPPRWSVRLPLHIAAALLGHIDLETTRGYANSRELHQTGEEAAGQQLARLPGRRSGRPDASILTWEDLAVIPSDASICSSGGLHQTGRSKAQRRGDQGVRG